MRKSAIQDIIWTLVVGGLAIGGIVLCAREQGNTHTEGLRIAMILAAIALGIAGGAITERLTRSRRRRKSRGPSRRSRRRNRKIAFIISGVIVATGITALYLVDETWLIVSAAIVLLAATWLWYTLEAMGLTRGMVPRNSRSDSEGYRKRKWE